MTRDYITHEIIEDERYELLEGPAYCFDTARREFIQILGAGLLISLSPTIVSAQRRRGGFGGGGSSVPTSQRFHIGADGIITVMTGKVEVGQGSRTEITQAAAEELRVPVDHIRLIMADTSLCPDDGGTSGSGTTPRTIPSIRNAAAAARVLLVDLAAKRLNIDAASLSVEDGKITDAKSKSSITYGDLAKGDGFEADFKATAGKNATLTPVEAWKVMGTPVAKVNGTDVVTGAHHYPSDIVRPGMLHGCVLRPASYGATLSNIDVSAAKALEGVTVVQDGDFVGCAAKSSFLARKAVELLAKNATWKTPPHPSSSDLFKYLKDHAHGAERGRRGGGGGDARGSVKDGLASAKKVLSASYNVSYIQHAPMETRAAVAEWADGKLTVWTGTQNPMRVKGELTQTFHLSDDRVRVIVPDTGGGFGGKHTGEVALEAARLAKAAGKPVSVQWSREEEFTWAYFRPAGVIDIKAGLDEQGKLVAWDFINYNSGGSSIATPYNVPNVNTQVIGSEAPLREGSYRALAATANTFARESFMDELAATANVDPLAFRLTHLSESRMRNVLEPAAKAFNWTERKTKRTANHGIGLACSTDKGSYVATCAEIEIHDNTIKVLNVCQAFECGAIQNPANLRAQVEGSIMMGIGPALREAIAFKNGCIENASFTRYRVPRYTDVPRLDIHLLNRPDLPSAGAGETPVIAIAPAIANAVFDATGTRIREMPITLPAV